jgi:hypothetical protein
MAAMEKMIPKQGYNLVGVDTYAVDPEEALFLMGHFDNKAEADDALKAKEAADPEGIYYLYDAGML